MIDCIQLKPGDLIVHEPFDKHHETALVISSHDDSIRDPSDYGNIGFWLLTTLHNKRIITHR